MTPRGELRRRQLVPAVAAVAVLLVAGAMLIRWTSRSKNRLPIGIGTTSPTVVSLDSHNITRRSAKSSPGVRRRVLGALTSAVIAGLVLAVIVGVAHARSESRLLGVSLSAMSKHEPAAASAVPSSPGREMPTSRGATQAASTEASPAAVAPTPTEMPTPTRGVSSSTRIRETESPTPAAAPVDQDKARSSAPTPPQKATVTPNPPADGHASRAAVPQLSPSPTAPASSPTPAAPALTPSPTATPAPSPTPAPKEAVRPVPSSRGVADTGALSAAQQFITSIVGPAQDSEKETGVPAAVTIAQAVLESDWGASLLAKEANNYFGIKATSGPGSAGVIKMDTWEVLGGGSVTVADAFKAYHTLEESFIDHGEFLRDNPRYAAAFKFTSDPAEFARQVAAAGYATDPAYASKLIALIQAYGLERYDVAR